MSNLKDAGLTLKPANIPDDLLDVGRSDPVDLRHIAELPMVGFDAEGGGALKRRVPVMIGLIDLVNERRTLLCARCLRTMAGRAMGVELGLAGLQFRRNRGSAGGGFWLRGVARSDRNRPSKPRTSSAWKASHRERDLVSNCCSPCRPRAGSVNCSRSILCVRCSVMRR